MLRTEKHSRRPMVKFSTSWVNAWKEGGERERGPLLGAALDASGRVPWPSLSVCGARCGVRRSKRLPMLQGQNPGPFKQAEGRQLVRGQPSRREPRQFIIVPIRRPAPSRSSLPLTSLPLYACGVSARPASHTHAIARHISAFPRPLDMKNNSGLTNRAPTPRSSQHTTAQSSCHKVQRRPMGPPPHPSTEKGTCCAKRPGGNGARGGGTNSLDRK
jgi:hypothetical protein